MTTGEGHLRTRLTLSEAIDQAGPVLYGTAWIQRLSKAERKILEKYGPKPYGRPQQSIGVCPSRSAVALDKAIGKDQRMLIQRATVFDWIRAAHVLCDLSHCDPTALDRKLEQSQRRKNPIGAPAVVRERVARHMREAINSGQLTVTQLDRLKQEAMQRQFGASRRVCIEARKKVLAELGTISN